MLGNCLLQLLLGSKRGSSLLGRLLQLRAWANYLRLWNALRNRHRTRCDSGTNRAAYLLHVLHLLLGVVDDSWRSLLIPKLLLYQLLLLR